MILVTGATGLVGSYLARYLLRAGEEVRAMKRPQSDFSLLGDDINRIQWVDGDILDLVSLEAAMKGVEKVYHVAAIVSFVRKEHERMLKVNNEGTANVVNTALNVGISKLLYMSGVVTLGKGKENMVLDEGEENIDSEYDTAYGLSKCLAEMEVWRAIMEGLNAVIINPSLVIGAGNWQSYGPAIFRWSYRGLPFYAPGSTGFVDVRDVAKASMALMNSNIKGERFIVSGENLTYRELGNLIAAQFGTKERTVRLSRPAMYVLAQTESFLAGLQNRVPFISPENIHLFSKHYRYSNQKIKERFGYQFIPIEQTVKETCDAFLRSKTEGQDYAVLPL